jgi:hypothetical protein
MLLLWSGMSHRVHIQLAQLPTALRLSSCPHDKPGVIRELSCCNCKPYQYCSRWKGSGACCSPGSKAVICCCRSCKQSSGERPPWAGGCRWPWSSCGTVCQQREMLVTQYPGVLWQQSDKGAGYCGMEVGTGLKCCIDPPSIVSLLCIVQCSLRHVTFQATRITRGGRRSQGLKSCHVMIGSAYGHSS